MVGADRRAFLLRLAERVKTGGVFVVANDVAVSVGLSEQGTPSLKPRGKDQQYLFFSAPRDPA